jgi:hypothetical protein
VDGMSSSRIRVAALAVLEIVLHVGAIAVER